MAGARRLAVVALAAQSAGRRALASDGAPLLEPLLGDYRPVSAVEEHAQVVYDVEAIANATSAGDWATAAAIYQGGRWSCKSESEARSLSAFAQAPPRTVFGCSFEGASCEPARAELRTGFGSGRLELPRSFWDDFILAAIDGSGSFLGLST